MNFDNYCFPPERERVRALLARYTAAAVAAAAAIPPRNCLANFRKFIAVFHIIQSYRRRGRYYCWKAILPRSSPFFSFLPPFFPAFFFPFPLRFFPLY